MTKLAAIEGQLVGIKNVSTHKSACLTIHVPEEYALKVIEAFGWPTMVAPVPVAIAKLDLNAKSVAEKPRGGKLAQRAGILCSERTFQTYIIELGAKEGLSFGMNMEEAAACYVRAECNVSSRAELDHNQEAARKFLDLVASYEAWKLI